MGKGVSTKRYTVTNLLKYMLKKYGKNRSSGSIVASTAQTVFPHNKLQSSSQQRWHSRYHCMILTILIMSHRHRGQHGCSLECNVGYCLHSSPKCILYHIQHILHWGCYDGSAFGVFSVQPGSHTISIINIHHHFAHHSKGLGDIATGLRGTLALLPVDP